MDTYTIKKIEYYKYDEIIVEYKLFKKGCSTKKDIINTHGLKEDSDYIYAKETGTKWIKADGKDKRHHKFFITKEWFDENFAGEGADKLKDKTEPAPPIIKLEDHEKFPNGDDFMEIEVRGKRSVDECYFKVEDVVEGFGVPRLHDIITKKTSSFKLNTHYKYFHSVKTTSTRKIKTKKLFLTYFGVLKVLFASRGENSENFAMWACKILFVAQMGTGVQRTALAGKLLGMDTKYVLNVLSIVPSLICCVYLFAIGTVDDLRERFNIDESIDGKSLVCKYGRTKDFIKRIKKHKKTYGNQIELVLYNFIDPSYVSKAEASLKHYFTGLDNFLETEIDGKPETELVILKKSQLKSVKDQYSMLGSTYAGEVSKHTQSIKDLMHNNEKALMIKDRELMAKDAELMVANHQRELVEKDNKYLLQTIEMMKLKSKK